MDCCYPLAEEGLGLKYLKIVDEAILRRFAWCLITGMMFLRGIMLAHLFGLV